MLNIYADNDNVGNFNIIDCCVCYHHPTDAGDCIVEAHDHNYTRYIHELSLNINIYMYHSTKKASNHRANLPLEMYSFTL